MKGVIMRKSILFISVVMLLFSSLSAITEDGDNLPPGAIVLTLPVEGDAYAIMPINDTDWYKIPAMSAGDTLIAYTTLTGSSNLNAKLWLWGPITDLTYITSNSFIIDSPEIEIMLRGSGDYYLRVAEFNNYPNEINPPTTKKNTHGENDSNVRDNTGSYNLFVRVKYNHDDNLPLSLEATNQAGFVELSWIEPPHERYLTGYHIYRNGEVITEDVVPVGTSFYHDTNVFVGSEYNYFMTCVYDYPQEFPPHSTTATIIYFNIDTPLWADDFEGHPDFTIDLQNWIQYDIDGGSTYNIGDVEFENAGDPMSYIVFNPATTTPPMTDILPYSGDKFLASFASSEGENNDWIITPRIIIGTRTLVSFYARSYSSQYDLEKFKVKLSLGGEQVEDFIFSLSQGQSHLIAPAEWTPFLFNVSTLSGLAVRFAIQCISSDAFIFMIDDFRIDSTDDAVDNENVEIILQLNTLNQNYPNPFNPETSISFTLKDGGYVSLDIYNIKGQKVKNLLNEHREAGNYNVIWNGTDDNNRSVASGVYLYKMKSGRFSSTKKMILLK